MSTDDNQQDYIVIWEQPKLEPPEFRLYYDDKGAVICYTGDKSMTGNYIVIDAQTFAAARPDIKIIDGKISTVSPKSVVYKLMPNSDEGVECIADDISIVTDSSYDGKTTKWKLKIYELE
jgi:hypothetical protein